MVRLQKFLADAGLASRRGSEALILAGEVRVNGRIVRELGVKVDAEHDTIEVNGVRVRPRRRLYVAVHKPRRCVCTRSDPQGRRTVGELLPREWSMLYPVGRLDYDTEGLLLMTNDGEFCLRLTHPRYGIAKRYVATVEGRVTPAVVRRLTRGIVDAGERLKASWARVLGSDEQERTRVELELTEGKNREVRRLFEAQGLRVARLKRTQVGRIKLGELPIGRWRVLSAAEVRTLLGEGATRRAAAARIPQD